MWAWIVDVVVVVVAKVFVWGSNEAASNEHSMVMAIHRKTEESRVMNCEVARCCYCCYGCCCLVAVVAVVAIKFVVAALAADRVIAIAATHDVVPARCRDNIVAIECPYLLGAIGHLIAFDIGKPIRDHIIKV